MQHCIFCTLEVGRGRRAAHLIAGRKLRGRRVRCGARVLLTCTPPLFYFVLRRAAAEQIFPNAARCDQLPASIH
ncbi:hypothetical protein JYU34_002530 [Plutella xylostella]|uniref:Uncharacterized protein n=1 Tax=Plutella xylostella TaxID=51655 RepID=A0ABQ7R2H1_PLUXY|nr:hypothetical protein JYU34_002530 [Plutella xylostella]